MLYSQYVKNMVSGISQQPDILRLAEQLDSQVNGFSTEAGGLQKRPPTLLLKKLFDITGNAKESLVHWVNRDGDERYSMLFGNNTIRVFDLNGAEKYVNIPSNLVPYITTSNPRRDLRVITIADYTFVLNRTKQVAMSSETSPARSQQGLVVVKSGQYGRTYQIIIDGQSVSSWTAPSGSASSDVLEIDTTKIAGHLVAGLQANSYVTARYDLGSQSNWIHIVPKAGVSMGKLETADGYNDAALTSFTDHAQRFNLLPAQAPDGYSVEILGDPTGGAIGSHWTRYNATKKIWEEIVKPGIQISYDPNTLPLQLVRNADGTFTLSTVSWDKRDAGDEDSNPLPSFVENTINDIFFYRNRLGFLAGENIILSENGNFFNFWMTTANDVLDTDTVDLPTTTTRINTLLYAVPWDQNLYVFSDSTQFILSSDTTLTPKNSALVEVTGFDSYPNCRPVVSGKNIYFAAERAEYTTIKEYYNVQQVSDVKNAQDITSHVPDYIPNGVTEIVSNTSENILLVQTEGDPTCLYVYKYLFMNENRVQSSWSKWDFGGDIVGSYFFGSELYLLIVRAGNSLELEKISFTYNTKDFADEPYRIYLDRKNVVTTATYDNVYEKSIINVGVEMDWVGKTPKSKQVQLVTWDGMIHTGTVADIMNNGGMWEIHGVDLTQGVCYIGVPFEFRVGLSKLYIRQTLQDGSTKAKTNGRLQLRAVKLNYADTGSFSVTVKSNAGRERTYTMTSRVLGTSSSEIGIQPSGTGQFRVPIQSLNTNTGIEIHSSEPLPLALIGYLWEGNFISRTKEV